MIIIGKKSGVCVDKLDIMFIELIVFADAFNVFWLPQPYLKMHENCRED